MKEPMTDARRKQLYRIKKRKRRKQCIRVALRMAVLCFLVLFAAQKTADLLRVDDSDRMEDAEQSYSGDGCSFVPTKNRMITLMSGLNLMMWI